MSCTWAAISIALLVGGPPAEIRNGLQASSTNDVVLCYGAQQSYAEAAASFRTALADNHIEVTDIELSNDLTTSARESIILRLRKVKPAFVGAAGVEATQLVMEALPDTPVVFFMVPNARDTLFQPGNSENKHVIGVTSDVSPLEWAKWISEVHPSGKTLAVLYSDRSVQTLDQITKAASTKGVTIAAIKADGDAFPKAVDDLSASKCDGVLMVLDAKVYNGPNIQRLLLWGIRTKTPIWAFSPKIVKAGALGGLYTASADVGRQAAQLLLKLRAGENVSPKGLQYPTKVQRAVNLRTADLIGVRIAPGVRDQVNEKYGTEP